MVGVGGGSGVVYGNGVLCSSADQMSVGKGVPCDIASGLSAGVGVLPAVLGILGRVLGSKGEQAIAISNMTIIAMAKETDIPEYLFFFSFVSFPAVCLLPARRAGPRRTLDRQMVFRDKARHGRKGSVCGSCVLVLHSAIHYSSRMPNGLLSPHLTVIDG